MDLGLRGRSYLVTGASSGVGLATSRLLLAEGANVIGCARDGTRLKAALDALPRHPAAMVVARSADVLDATAMEAVVRAGVAEVGGIDGIVNNAGRSLLAEWHATSPEQWRAEFELKILGVLNTIEAGLPWMARSRSPAIVNVNAVLARQPESRLAATSAARAALLNLSRTLAHDLAEDGIRVNSVCLGLIDTGQWRRRFDTSGAEDFDVWSTQLATDRGVAVKRLGRADEVAWGIVSLLTPLASYITGTSIDIDGGAARYV